MQLARPLKRLPQARAGWLLCKPQALPLRAARHPQCPIQRVQARAHLSGSHHSPGEAPTLLCFTAQPHLAERCQKCRKGHVACSEE